MKKIKNTLKQLDSIPLPDKEKMLSFNKNSLSTEKKIYVPQNIPKIKFKLRPAWSFSILLAVLIFSFSGYKIIAEELEYKEAVNFFVENGLSTDGLSKNDIKIVYRDITTKKFSQNKTAEIIEKNVAGHEIFQNAPSPEDIENLWNFKKNSHYILNNNFMDYNDEISYAYQYTEKFDDKLGRNIDKYSFVKYNKGQKIWSTELDNFSIGSFTVSKDLILVYGTSFSNSSFDTRYGRLALLNSDGEILWDKTTSNGFKKEYIASVLFDNDNIIAFSRGDLKYLCFLKYDLQGNLIKSTKNEIGNHGIYSAVKLGEDYLVQLKSIQTGEILMKVKSDGSLSDSFSYSSNETDYYITSMIEYNNNIFLSAYAVSKLYPNEKDYGGRFEIARILGYVFDNENIDISSEELTKLVRENYTAILLVCNPETGVPNEFFSVNGSIGANLFINEENKLIWETESISDTYLSLGTSSFTIGGSSYIYRHEFDEQGKIKNIEKTDEIRVFRR